MHGQQHIKTFYEFNPLTTVTTTCTTCSTKQSVVCPQCIHGFHIIVRQNTTHIGPCNEDDDVFPEEQKPNFLI